MRIPISRIYFANRYKIDRWIKLVSSKYKTFWLKFKDSFHLICHSKRSNENICTNETLQEQNFALRVQNLNESIRFRNDWSCYLFQYRFSFIIKSREWMSRLLNIANIEKESTSFTILRLAKALYDIFKAFVGYEVNKLFLTSSGLINHSTKRSKYTIQLLVFLYLIEYSYDSTL